MASWIVHLRVAEYLLSQIEGLDSGLFAIGNIAPDSGIPDEKWEKFDPPPEVTHFKQDDHSAYHTADLVFLRKYLLPLRARPRGSETFSFRLGYYFHLVTDNLWITDIFVPTEALFRAQLDADPDWIWEIKKDWYGLDHAFVRDHPDSLFWRVFLGCQYLRDELEFLPGEAVRQRIRYIQEYYRADNAEVREMLARPFIYLSKSSVDKFVQRSAERLLRIYRQVWLEGNVPPGGSVLESIF